MRLLRQQEDLVERVLHSELLEVGEASPPRRPLMRFLSLSERFLEQLSRVFCRRRFILNSQATRRFEIEVAYTQRLRYRGLPYDGTFVLQPFVQRLHLGQIHRAVYGFAPQVSIRRMRRVPRQHEHREVVGDFERRQCVRDVHVLRAAEYLTEEPNLRLEVLNMMLDGIGPHHNNPPSRDGFLHSTYKLMNHSIPTHPRPPAPPAAPG